MAHQRPDVRRRDGNCRDQKDERPSDRWGADRQDRTDASPSADEHLRDRWDERPSERRGEVRRGRMMDEVTSRGCSSDEQPFADRRSWDVQVVERARADLLDPCGLVLQPAAARRVRALVLVWVQPAVGQRERQRSASQALAVRQRAAVVVRQAAASEQRAAPLSRHALLLRPLRQTRG